MGRGRIKLLALGLAFVLVGKVCAARDGDVSDSGVGKEEKASENDPRPASSTTTPFPRCVTPRRTAENYYLLYMLRLTF
jgi:hypothetical protein